MRKIIVIFVIVVVGLLVFLRPNMYEYFGMLFASTNKTVNEKREWVKEAKENMDLLDAPNEKLEQNGQESIASIDIKPNSATYIPNIKLYAFQAQRYNTYDGQVPGVEFKLKNEGDRELSMVEVTVYFKDVEGNVIAEENYRPINAWSYSMGAIRFLKAGYIYQMPKGEFLKAEHVPDEWEEGIAEAKVTDMKFRYPNE